MKRTSIGLLLLGTLVSISCSKSGSNPMPPQPALPFNTPEPLQYVIDDLKGTALIFPEGSTQGEKAEEEQVIESGDEIITKTDSEMTLSLDENTQFHVSSNSDVIVDQLIPNNSKGFASRLKLVEGGILCEVEKLSESNSSFEVTSGGVICGVRGTAFEVQKQGQYLYANTFHGIVEVKNGDQDHQINADQHMTFSYKSRAFIPIRPLEQVEKGHYQSWLEKREVAQRKWSERRAVLGSIADLPPEERARVLHDVSKVKPKDRVKTMRQILQKTYIPEPSRAPQHPLGKTTKDRPQKRSITNKIEKTRADRPKGGEKTHALKSSTERHSSREKRSPRSKRPGVSPKKVAHVEGKRALSRPTSFKKPAVVHSVLPHKAPPSIQKRSLEKPARSNKPKDRRKELKKRKSDEK